MTHSAHKANLLASFQIPAATKNAFIEKSHKFSSYVNEFILAGKIWRLKVSLKNDTINKTNCRLSGT